MDQVSPTGTPPSEEQEKSMPCQKKVLVSPLFNSIGHRNKFPALTATQESTKNANVKLVNSQQTTVFYVLRRPCADVCSLSSMTRRFPMMPDAKQQCSTKDYKVP